MASPLGRQGHALHGTAVNTPAGRAARACMQTAPRLRSNPIPRRTRDDDGLVVEQRGREQPAADELGRDDEPDLLLLVGRATARRRRRQPLIATELQTSSRQASQPGRAFRMLATDQRLRACVRAGGSLPPAHSPAAARRRRSPGLRSPPATPSATWRHVVCDLRATCHGARRRDAIRSGRRIGSTPRSHVACGSATTRPVRARRAARDVASPRGRRPRLR